MGSSSYPEINILLVDDDPITLSILAGVLQKMYHHVVAMKNPLDALYTLRMKKQSFDLILTDVHMPEMSGLDLLKHVERDFKIPVVLMSADQDKGIMLNGLELGAVFYLIKPLSAYDLSRLWQYAITTKESTNKTNNEVLPSFGMSPMITSEMLMHFQNPNNGYMINNEFEPSSSDVQLKKNRAKNNKGKKLKRVNGGGIRKKSCPKKPKLVWTTSLHNIFLEAVHTIGLEKAVPKKILELMNVPGLRRENVASHLQKYRIFLKKIAEATGSMQYGIPSNWNERPFRSSFVLNEITFLTNTLQQQYLELLAQSQVTGKLNGGTFFEKGESSSSQGLNSFGDHIKPNDHMQLYPNQGSQIPNQNVPILDQLPSFKGIDQQGLFSKGSLSFDKGQSSQDVRSSSNPRSIGNLQPITNNYVGLRISTNGELISPFIKNSSIINGNGIGNNPAKDIYGTNHIEKTYEMNFGHNNNSLQISNATLIDQFLGLDDANVDMPNFDHNASQQENSFGMSQNMSSMQGITDELRQLWVDLHLDKESHGNDLGFGDAQSNAEYNLFDGLDQGITGSDDDISFEWFFNQEDHFNNQQI
ncbi:unnamed protein product [Amaranthus hypochondriacus]